MRVFAILLAIGGLACAVAAGCRLPLDVAGNGNRIAGTANLGDLAATPREVARTGGRPPMERWNGSGKSAISLTVRWPDRATQAIPGPTARIDFAVFPMGETGPLLQRSIDRASGQATASIELSPLPPTFVVLSAIGRDSAGAAIAAAGAYFDLRPNARARGNISLQPNATASVSGFHPPAALPGQRVAVFGSGFGDTTARAVAIGTRTLPASGIVPLNSGIVYFDVPADTGSGKLVVAGATSSATFATIRSLSLAASGSSELFLRGTRELAYSAKDASGSLLSVPVRHLPWSIDSEACFDCSENAPTEIDASELGLLSDKPGTEGAELRPHSLAILLGSTAIAGENKERFKVTLGTPQLSASVTLTSREIKPSDLPADLRATPAPVPYPSDNPHTDAKAVLGKRLFFDTKLSPTGKFGCVTCHLPEKDWTDGTETPPAQGGGNLTRHSPTILGAGHNPLQFWDGRAPKLEDQARAVFHNPKEIGSDFKAVLDYIKADSTYPGQFQAAFGTTPASTDDVDALMPKAIATFVRLQNFGQSPFDKWAAGDDAALSRNAKIGLGTFLGSANCIACHSGLNFTDGKFHNIGIPGSGTLDEGRKAATGQSTDRGAFKTPTLRNVVRTAPYFHDGKKKTLAEAVKHYEIVDPLFDNLDEKIQPRSIDGLNEIIFVQAFLRTLTSATPSVSP
jgi:cytochrome c peroxidase